MKTFQHLTNHKQLQILHSADHVLSDRVMASQEALLL